MVTLPDEQTRVFLWHMPRSLSTCLAKCLSYVDGVQVWHEPYSLAFDMELMEHFSESRTSTPDTYIDSMMALRGRPNEFSGGRFMPSENFTYPWIKSQLEKDEAGKKYILIKDTAYSIYNHIDALPNVASRHTFLIRHPHRCMLSWKKVEKSVSGNNGDADFVLPERSTDAYFSEDFMHLLWRHVIETSKDPNPIIIDAEDLRNYPEKVLPKYLGALGIPYRGSYTSWDASEESIKTWKGGLEWAVYGKQMGIYDRAFGCSGFSPNNDGMPRKEELTEDITRVTDSMMPGYQEMYEQRLKPE